MRAPSLVVAFAFLAFGAAPLLAQPSLSISGINVTEGNSATVQAVVTVTLTPASSAVVTVDYESTPANPPATGGASCTGGVDFINPIGTVRFDPGVVSQTISVAACGDTADELDEKFRVVLRNAVGATITTAQGTVTILDDDVALPILSIGDDFPDVTEGNAGSTAVIRPVTLSAASASVVTVDFSLHRADATPGAACGGVVDFVQPGGTVRFNPGVVSRDITLLVCGDTADERDEFFRLLLSNPTGATLADLEGKGEGAVTIIDDDAPGVFPQISISDRTVPEGNAGSAEAVLRIALSTATTHAVTLRFETEEQSATGTGEVACSDGGRGTDFVHAGGRLQFNPGETRKDLRVIICPDTAVESDEIFRVQLTEAAGATIQDATSQVTITNDDATLSITSLVEIVEPRTTVQAPAVFTVTLAGQIAQTVTVQFATTPGSARAGTDCQADPDYLTRAGTLTFSPGTTTRQIEVPVCRDIINNEPPETFTVTLSNPVNATILAAVGRARILR